MCIVFFTSNEQYSLIVASNRDEFLARPTAAATWHAWTRDGATSRMTAREDQRVLSGLDLSAGGTWFGISLAPPRTAAQRAEDAAAHGAPDRIMHFATLTNFTETIDPNGPPKPSRGNLVRDFLDRAGDPTALESYLEQLEENKQQFAGFNLLLGEIGHDATLARSGDKATPAVRLGYTSNRENPRKRARVLQDFQHPFGSDSEPHPIKVRGLSNATLEVEEGETEWPKIKSGAAAIARVVEEAQTRATGADRDVRADEAQLMSGLYHALSTAHPSPIQHREHLRETVLVRPLCLDPSRPLDALPPPLPSAVTLSEAPLSDPTQLPAEVAQGKREGEDGVHWYGTRVQTLLLVERATGRVVFEERDAFVLDLDQRPKWSGEKRRFDFRL